jgi:hypothetical protein
METNKVREGKYFYKGQDITHMQIWDLQDALADILDKHGIFCSHTRHTIAECGCGYCTAVNL